MVIDQETGAPKVLVNWQRSLTTSYGLIFCIFGGFGAWAATARLDSAVIAPGIVAAESSKKTIQHYEGGIVREILVHDGDHVKAGDVLVRLDPTRAQASSQLYGGQYAASLAAEARLLAERDSTDAVVFPPEVLSMQADPLVARAIVDQRRQFEAARDSFQRQVAVAESQIDQIKEEVTGHQQERATAQGQLVFSAKQVESYRDLYGKKLIDYAKLADMEKEQLSLQGSIAKASIAEAQANQKINETKLQVERLRQQRREDASKDLVDVRKTLGDLNQQMIVTADTLKRVDITAPIEGTVQEMKVFTIGGVVRAADPILDIVPTADELVIRAQISPLDVDAMRAGMTAEVRFESFHSAAVPYMTGQVRSISRDRIVDPVARETYFAAEIIVDKKTVPPEVDDKLTAGLPASVIVRTGERTAMQYLVSPIMERFHTAMREE